MKKILFSAAVLLLSLGGAQAGEGMWLLNLLKQVNEAQMQQLGFKLTAEDIYSLNKSGVKDGVVRLGGGFCTGEMVSADGLMLTNHHCGYDAVQELSTEGANFLDNGFWAKTRAEELPAGFEVSFLQRIEDVTPQVLAVVTDDMDEQTRRGKIREVSSRLEREAETGPYILADFKVMFEGNQFFLFVYKSYPDVRLAGVPPSAIGKFGGDTDNWMWPRHTGDFSMFRVYAGADGEPAEYSKDNQPYHPKWHFPISLDGVKDGDFAMIMGYPGRTNRFMCSDGVDLELEISQPSVVKIRTELLKLWKEDMDKDNSVRLKYASKYASTANYWKYFIGQQRGLKRLHVEDKKLAQEKELMAWIDADPARKAKYGECLSLLDQGFAERAKFQKAATYLNEALFGSEAIEFGFNFLQLKDTLKSSPKNAAAIAAMVTEIQEAMKPYFKDYNAPTDEKATASLYRMYFNDVDPSQHPDLMRTIATKYKGDFNAWAKALFATSILSDRARMDKFLAKPTYKVLDKDLGVQAAASILAFLPTVQAAMQAPRLKIDRGYRLMVAAMMEKDPQKMWYPNANSTMRLTYGVVNDYSPGDAMKYDFITTGEGILQKEDNTSDEFTVPKRQHELLVAKDYGRYADADGKLVVCFLSENDITGGNSGSPVINDKAELIGIAFDGNWEAMSGDIAYEPELQRTISVDIRYVLWVIDKFAGAKHLVDEMTIVQTPKEQTKVVPAMMPEVVPVPKGKNTSVPAKKG
ncbi:MAG: S46 family peptidase [Flavobacteriales bacterium]|nr:S46 family peptidase [Flavobacteriales bacterium]